MEKSKEEIKTGRLEKKIAKLRKQVNHYKEMCVTYGKILNFHPNLQSRYEVYEDMVKERNRIRQLELRVVEQAKLIALLEKQNDASDQNH